MSDELRLAQSNLEYAEAEIERLKNALDMARADYAERAEQHLDALIELEDRREFMTADQKLGRSTGGKS
jgi:hemerythrin-like domain-containing protein